MLDLPLSKPLVFFDLETTGTDMMKDRIVQYCFIRIETDGKEAEPLIRLVNPEMKIPREATAVHGISDADVEDENPFHLHAEAIMQYIWDCDLAGYNVEGFDFPMLVRNLYSAFPSQEEKIHRWTRRVRIVDVMTIFHRKVKRNLSFAYHWYTGKTLHDAHSASADVRATMEVLFSQIQQHPDIGTTVEALDTFCHSAPPGYVDSGMKFAWRDGKAWFTFGKHEGKTLNSVAQNDPDYLAWMIKKAFPEDTIQVARKALNGEFPIPEQEARE